MGYHSYVLYPDFHTSIERASLHAIEYLNSKSIAPKDCCLVGTGISGVMAAAKFSLFTGIKAGFIRKESDKNNHEFNGAHEEINGAKYLIFVDDFISSGSTFNSLSDKIKDRYGKSFFGYLLIDKFIGSPNRTLYPDVIDLEQEGANLGHCDNS